MNIDLTSKNILVTGASRGIGRAIAKSLLEAGANVALHYNSGKAVTEELLKYSNGNSLAIQADLQSVEDTINLWQKALNHFGQIDGLVNNAGIAVSSSVDKADDEWLNDWDFTNRINLRATALLCKKAVEHMQTKPEGGRIVNISSRAAFRGDTAEYVAYAASKGGVVALTRSIARAFGKQNIKAFNVAPGFTRTDMAQDFIDQYGEDYALNDIALNTLTQPNDVAPSVVFLLSGYADHATGATLDINAGSYVR